MIKIQAKNLFPMGEIGKKKPKMYPEIEKAKQELIRAIKKYNKEGEGL